MTRTLGITLLGCGAHLFYAGEATACSIPSPEPHVVDDSLASMDATPPSAPSDVTAAVSRGTGPESTGCGQSSRTSCDDIGSWRLMFAPSEDDQSGPSQIGYIVELEKGRVPGLPDVEPGECVTPEPVRGGTEDEVMLQFAWSDGDEDDQESLDFTIVLRAVDHAGNVGEPSEPFRIRHGGSTGCAYVGGTSNSGWIVFGVALVAALGRRFRHPGTILHCGR